MRSSLMVQAAAFYRIYTGAIWYWPQLAAICRETTVHEAFSRHCIPRHTQLFTPYISFIFALCNHNIRLINKQKRNLYVNGMKDTTY